MRRMEFLTRRYRDRLKREDRRAGGIIAALYNINTRTEETDPIRDWQDFFTEWKEVRDEEEQTEEEMLKMMMLFTKQREDLSH